MLPRSEERRVGKECRSRDSEHSFFDPRRSIFGSLFTKSYYRFQIDVRRFRSLTHRIAKHKRKTQYFGVKEDLKIKIIEVASRGL